MNGFSGHRRQQAIRLMRGGQLSCAAVAVFLAVPGAAHAETLADAVAQAYRTNPTLLGQRAQLRGLDETYVQARAGYRPTIGLYADGSHQDVQGAAQNDSDYGLSLSQPVYTGGRVTAEINAARGDILSGREALRQTESNVLRAVVGAYVDVRRDEQAYAIRQKDLEDLTTQVHENQTRFEAGDLTRTDVAQSQASQAAARALLAQAQAQLAISRATYASVVGQMPGALEPEPDLPVLPATIDQALDLAERNSPVVRGAKYDEKASRERIAEARAEGLPQVNLRATWGYENNRSNYLPDLYGRALTGSASFSQPLFAGGAIQSRIRQASERNTSDKLRVDQTVRDVTLRAARAWNQFGAAQTSIAASQAEVEAATVAYDGTEIERKAGQRTTLEVLAAEQAKRDAELNLVNARHDIYLAQADVLGAVGLLEARFLIPSSPLYDPTKPFNRVKGKGFVPWEPLIAGVDGLAVPRLEALSDVKPEAAPPRSDRGH